MKKFAWPLQRLLDVTQRREQALRAELARLASQIASLRAVIAKRQSDLDRLLENTGRLALEQRLAQQEVLMSGLQRAQKEIVTLEDQLKSLRAKRSETMEKFLKQRSSRKTLERLREAARERYRKEQDRAELKQLDEAGQMAFVRAASKDRI